MGCNILSIDVEEIFHAEYARNKVDHGYYRSVDCVPYAIDLLDDFGVMATFFVVGELIERFPEILRMITRKGHEVAFHGWSHAPLWEQDEASFRDDLGRFLILHPGCLGYRAPSFSLDGRTKWALDILSEKGMKYDSSLFPAKTPLYGVSNAPIRPYKPSRDNLCDEDSGGKAVWEFPLTTFSLLGWRVPAAGGFYLRLWPGLVNRALKRLNAVNAPAVIYLHSWELDPMVPRFDIGLYRSFITYHNIEKTKVFLKELLHRFRFTCFRDYLKEQMLSV